MTRHQVAVELGVPILVIFLGLACYVHVRIALIRNEQQHWLSKAARFLSSSSTWFSCGLTYSCLRISYTLMLPMTEASSHFWSDGASVLHCCSGALLSNDVTLWYG